jgi:predicted membrane metal-binding protein
MAYVALILCVWSVFMAYKGDGWRGKLLWIAIGLLAAAYFGLLFMAPPIRRAEPNFQTVKRVSPE